MNRAANNYDGDHCPDEPVAHGREHPARDEHHAGHDTYWSHAGHDHSDMVADFRKRFWACLLLTLPVLALSPMIRHMLGLEDHWWFTGDTYLLAAISSFIYFYGGWPFLDGLR